MLFGSQTFKTQSKLTIVTSQFQLDNTYEEVARQKAEIDGLRNELAKTKIELEASASGDQKVRAGLQAAIDTILTLDFHSQEVVGKFRAMCDDRTREGTEVVRELNELAMGMQSSRMRTTISKGRDGVIALNRALLDGMDNALSHHGTSCPRLFFLPLGVYHPTGYMPSRPRAIGRWWKRRLTDFLPSFA